VRVLLWEGEDEAAWHEAQTGGCSDDLWLRLADRRAKGAIWTTRSPFTRAASSR
jgi:hypothetical protein